MPWAVIDPDKCKPENCAEGKCAVRKECPTKAIWQEEPGDIPACDSSRCHACSKCVRVCPMKAILLTQ